MFSDYDTPTPASVYLIINPDQKVESVSYTHLTLPTKVLV